MAYEGYAQEGAAVGLEFGHGEDRHLLRPLVQVREAKELPVFDYPAHEAPGERDRARRHPDPVVALQHLERHAVRALEEGYGHVVVRQDVRGKPRELLQYSLDVEACGYLRAYPVQRGEVL